jgi:hypothetical protein
VIYTYWRNEQLLWRHVGEAAPARLPALRGFQRALGAALAVATATLVARLYLASPPRPLGAATVAATAAALAAMAGYLAARRGAQRAVREAHARRANKVEEKTEERADRA